MKHFFPLGFLGLAVFFSQTVIAADAAKEAAPLLIMPPRYDYHAICKAGASRFDPAEIEKLRQRSLTELPAEALVRLAEAYGDNAEVIAPDYPFALAAIEQVLKLPYRGENREFIDDALFLKYDLLYKGKAGEERRHEAKAILDTLIARNHAKAHRRLGEMHEDEQHFSEAAASYKKAIIGGNMAAYFNLARLYQEKPGTASAEFRRALSNLQQTALQAIAKGDCRVMVDLAKFYETLPWEEAQAHSLAWYRQAASVPMIPAKLTYARLLTRHSDDPDSWARAAALWEEAAGLGSVTAMRRLGGYYLSGRAFDPARAEQWLRQAAARPDVKISTLMQWAESLKHREPPSHTEIIGVYERAASQGHVEAWYRLGRLYQYDMRVPGHLDKAVAYYRKAAGARHVPAMRALQEAYSCSIGVGFNAERAEFWRREAEVNSDEAVVAAFYAAAKNDFADITRATLRRLESLATGSGYGNIEAQAAWAAYHFYRGDRRLAARQIDTILRQDIEEGSDYSGYFALGELFHSGSEKDYGLKLLQQAADAGNAAALERLGDMHAERRQYPQAIAYYQEAAGEKDSAHRKLYRIHLDSGNVADALKHLEHLAKKDDAGAMLRLAAHHHQDLKNEAGARYWFDQAVRHYPCDPEAVQQIAASYLHADNGAPLNREKGEQWLRYLYRMPLHGHINPIGLARAFLYQEGGSENSQKKQEALQALMRMSEAGHREAGQTLLDHYLLTMDAKQLVAMLTGQAEKGSVDSMIYLSNLYLSGFSDIPPSRKKAVYWLEQAKTAGSATATQRLSLLAQ